MDAKQRCENAIAAGKFKTAEAWCAHILTTSDPRAEPLKQYAASKLDELVGNRAWLWKLRARKDAGERLAECQNKAIKLLTENENGSMQHGVLPNSVHCVAASGPARDESAK